jgi:autotransporter-associated beta strand protein
MKPPRSLCLFSTLILSAQLSLAGSAQWKLNPGSSDWNTESNWTPETVPNDPLDTAMFAISNTSDVSVSHSVRVNAVTFDSSSSTFTITVAPGFPSLGLRISGVGIANNAGHAQHFVAATDSSGRRGVITFSQSASAGNSTTFLTEPARAASTIIYGGGMDFFDTSHAGNAIITNAGVTLSPDPLLIALGGDTSFYNSASADHAIIYDQGATGSNGFGGSTRFLENSTAAHSQITSYGGSANDAGGGYVRFFENATADDASLIANSGGNGGDGASIYFFDNSIGGTARAAVFGNAAGDLTDGHLDISCHDTPGVTIGSVEGNGTVFLGGNELFVGNNNLSTTFSGVIVEGGYCDGAGGSVAKSGTGTFSLTNGNSYTGGTYLSGGILQALHDGALGGGDVTVLTSGTTLTLQGGATNDYIADAATLNIVSSSTVNLNFNGTDVIGVLIVDGVAQQPKLYGSDFAKPASRSDGRFIGPGHILPELPVAVSRKMHNGTPFDIYLPATGTPGIECRTGGGSNTYQIVVGFLNNATFSSASVTSGQGTVVGTSGSGTRNVSISLNGVTNSQTVNVTLFNLNDGLGTRNLVIPMSVLVGDTNGNGSVNASDIAQTKTQSGHAITNSNFREDVNQNGVINSSDVIAVKARSGTALP